jgi:FlaA1/EpsC-like NDP-sugar epimerase
LGFTGRYFCVSTDKAANPVNLMGASKRLMEHLIFSGAVAPGLRAEVSSARFANVAFSDGSLLDGFLKRLQKRQPLAVPRDTRRYFVSLREAGQICLLAAVVAPAGHILVPRLDAEKNLRDLEVVAAALLRQMGLRARIYDEEQAAKDSLERDLSEGFYPLLLTALDTSGEKPFEEFVGQGERLVDIGLAHLAAVPYTAVEVDRLHRFIAHMEAAVAGRSAPPKEEIVAWIGDVMPEFKHFDTGKHLDQRM